MSKVLVGIGGGVYFLEDTVSSSSGAKTMDEYPKSDVMVFTQNKFVSEMEILSYPNSTHLLSRKLYIANRDKIKTRGRIIVFFIKHPFRNSIA